MKRRHSPEAFERWWRKMIYRGLGKIHGGPLSRHEIPRVLCCPRCLFVHVNLPPDEAKGRRCRKCDLTQETGLWAGAGDLLMQLRGVPNWGWRLSAWRWRRHRYAQKAHYRSLGGGYHGLSDE